MTRTSDMRLEHKSFKLTYTTRSVFSDIPLQSYDLYLTRTVTLSYY